MQFPCPTGRAETMSENKVLSVKGIFRPKRNGMMDGASYSVHLTNITGVVEARNICRTGYVAHV
jgi:hypothetical protein